MQQDSAPGWEQSSVPELWEHLSRLVFHDDWPNYLTTAQV